jgi:hypothetical protein
MRREPKPREPVRGCAPRAAATAGYPAGVQPLHAPPISMNYLASKKLIVDNTCNYAVSTGHFTDRSVLGLYSE